MMEEKPKEQINGQESKPKKQSKPKAEYMLFDFRAIRIGEKIYRKWDMITGEAYDGLPNGIRSAFLKLGDSVPDHIYAKLPADIKKKFKVGK